ncbi:MAG: hypothetical protein R2784_06350 [Saprospiraceae bacterium]
MKPIYFFLILVLNFNSLYSQDNGKKSKSIHAPEVKEATQNMHQGAKNAFSITLVDVEDKLVENQWEDLIKNYKGKVKNVKKADEKIAEAIRIQAISGTGDINVYSKAEEQGDDVLFTVWFEMDNGNFSVPEIIQAVTRKQFLSGEFWSYCQKKESRRGIGS